MFAVQKIHRKIHATIFITPQKWSTHYPLLPSPCHNTLYTYKSSSHWHCSASQFLPLSCRSHTQQQKVILIFLTKNVRVPNHEFFHACNYYWTFFLCKIPIFLGNNCFMNSLINMEIWLFHYICFIADSCFLLCTPASICYLPHIYRIINYLLNKAG